MDAPHDAPPPPASATGLSVLDGPLAWLELARSDGASAPLAFAAPDAPGGAAALAFTPAGEEALRAMLPRLPQGARVARLAADDWRAKEEAFRAAVAVGAGEVWLDPAEAGARRGGEEDAGEEGRDEGRDEDRAGGGRLEPRARIASHRAALYALSYKTGTACL